MTISATPPVDPTLVVEAGVEESEKYFYISTAQEKACCQLYGIMVVILDYIIVTH